MSNWPEYAYLLPEILRVWPIAVGGFHYLELFQQRVVLVLMLGDVLAMLRQMTTRVDAWYLDGFAPGKNPQMWNEALFKQIARLTKPGGSFATFTAEGAVRRGLKEAGFDAQKVPGYGRKREMLRGQLTHKPTTTSTQPWFQYPPPPIPLP